MTEEQAGRRERITLAVTKAEKEAVRDVAARMPEVGGEGPLLRRYSLEEVIEIHRRSRLNQAA